MNGRLRGILGPAVVACIGESVKRFRVMYAVLLAVLGISLIVAVVGMDLWGFPSWPVYALAVALVVASLLHARLCRAFEQDQAATWERLMLLASGVEAEARKAGVRPPPPTPPKPPTTRPSNRPPLRIVRPDTPDGA